ncbi:hypothetical protein Tco_0931275 [Tanacetum coccineum]
MKLVELVNQRKKFFAQQRAEAKRNKPMNPDQQKAYMSTYIKNQEGGYSIKQLKSLSFEQVKEIFKVTMRRVQSFVPMDSKLEVQRLKGAGQEVFEETAKRQKIEEASGSDDLDKLWSLVKERFSSTDPTDDKERILWVELKRIDLELGTTKDSRNRNQDSSRRTVNVKETSSKAMVAIDGAGFDWNYMAHEEVPTNMALMAFSDSEFNKSEFNLATYKRGLASIKEQLVFYKKNKVIFCEQLVVLKRDISYKYSELSMLKRELEKLKQ